jgi:hypothetical protein
MKTKRIGSEVFAIMSVERARALEAVARAAGGFSEWLATAEWIRPNARERRLVRAVAGLARLSGGGATRGRR